MEFRDWMESALYDKERGYYTTRLDSIPDYVTAPNFGPYLGQTIARELGRAWHLLPVHAQPKVFSLVEVGCGSQASLTRSILETLQTSEPGLYSKLQAILVDRSVPRLSQALDKLSRAFPNRVFGCPDMAQIPKVWGAVISNELLDAFPVRLLRRTSSDTVEEGHVETKGLREGLKETPNPVLGWKKCGDPVRISWGLDLPIGKVYALNLEALKYLEILANRLEHGLILTIDFGDLRPAIFERSPVKAFSKGQVKTPNFAQPGSEDVTSSVDFSMLIDWGSRLGLDTLQYETLGSFLMRNGIGDMLVGPDNRTNIEKNLKIKALIHPYGFGEDFKVLIQGK